MKDGQTALKNGDLTAYAQAQSRLDAAVQDAISAENRLGEAGG